MNDSTIRRAPVPHSMISSPQAHAPRQAGPAAQAPAENPLQGAATRAADALVRMKEADRDAVIGAVPGLVSDIASQVVGGALDSRIVSRNKAQLTALIRQGTTKIAAETSAAGSRVADLRAALTAEGGRPQVVALAADALAAIAARAGVQPADFEKLAGRMEILAELQGEKRFAMISNRPLKAKIMQLTNGNLGELAGAVGRQLATLAYEPVKRLATVQELT